MEEGQSHNRLLPDDSARPRALSDNVVSGSYKLCIVSTFKSVMQAGMIDVKGCAAALERTHRP